MSDQTEGRVNSIVDTFGTKDLLTLVAGKLTSQALLFGLVLVVLLVVAFQLFGSEGLPVIAAILFVFVVAIGAYAFFEQKAKVEKEDPATMGRLLANRIGSIEQPSGSFSVRVWATRAGDAGPASRDVAVVPTGSDGKIGTFRIGDRVQVHFTSTRDCYLTLLNVGTSGKLTVLFPNAIRRENFVSANQIYSIPAADYGFEYELQGPPGVEKLKAIATLEKKELLESQFAKDGSFFRTSASAAAARDIAVVKSAVEAIPASDWAEAHYEFRVEEKKS